MCKYIRLVCNLLYKQGDNNIIHTYFCMCAKRNTVQILPKANKNSHQKEKEGLGWRGQRNKICLTIPC